ncbi:hypothetical protein KAW18_11615 [candidate division WOR-3 bacterium]|nr:hypothetical protein [candidate division WOR-3 bacterium]
MKNVSMQCPTKCQGSQWYPPLDAEPFCHSSINYCDEMDTHNKILDHDASVTGTTGTTGNPLSNIATHGFDTYWQAQSATPDDDQYFELTLSDSVYVDSYIMNFHIPYPYTTAPYIPDMSCWKGWTLKGKLNSGDSWTTLETVTNNAIKFYRGTFTRGQYKYFRVESITAYSNQAQDVRIDAYLYTMGLYDSAYKYVDQFPDPCRGRNDHGSNPESTEFTNHDVYISCMTFLDAAVYDLNGEMSKVVKGQTIRQYRHIGGLRTEFGHDVTTLNRLNAIKFTRLNSTDFVSNSDICLYMLPPPNELWWFMNSGYAFDETSANMNTPIVLKSPDNAHKLTPVLTTTRQYTSFAVIAARYSRAMSGVFKVNKNYIVFSDYVNMESQIRFDGQEGKGLITDMDGTALTGCVNGVSNVNVARLEVGNVWRGRFGTHYFDPPIKLDGDVSADLFEMSKSEKVKGSVLRYKICGWKVPKP